MTVEEKKKNGKRILGELNRQIINEYINKFKGDTSLQIAEKTLTEVFHKYCQSIEKHEILIKVVLLNQLYNAGLTDNYRLNGEVCGKVNVFLMAERLSENSEKIDSWFSSDMPNIAVDNIVKLFPNNDRPYSFVSKYCNWSFPEKYPIVDSYAKGVLYYYFKDSKKYKQWQFNDYKEYCNIFNEFRKCDFCNGLSIKEIDMFLWMFGKSFGLRLDN